jgi:hypothetical protein
MSASRMLDIALSQGLRGKPKGGAPRGNCNALKTGLYTADAIARRETLGARLAEFRRHVRLVLYLAWERADTRSRPQS